MGDTCSFFFCVLLKSTLTYSLTSQQNENNPVFIEEANLNGKNSELSYFVNLACFSRPKWLIFPSPDSALDLFTSYPPWHIMSEVVLSNIKIISFQGEH